MLENMYENIGGKIKGLAKWIFIVEALGSIITGLILAFEEDSLFILMAICGPIVAWVSSWVLYAFGELVEKICDNESHNKEILKLLRQNNNAYSTYSKSETKKKTEDAKTQAPEQTENPTKVKKETAVSNEKIDLESDFAKNTWKCEKCGKRNLNSRNDCWACGAKYEKSDMPS